MKTRRYMKREMTKQERFDKELAILTEGMIKGSKEWQEQLKWLAKKFYRVF